VAFSRPYLHLDEAAVAFALRPENVRLKEFFDRFVGDVYRGMEYNMARQKYFEPYHDLNEARSPDPAAEGQLSPYDELLKKYSRLYRMDWRLMAAQAFQESRFDPHARSWAGAEGLFQIMPRTARELGFDDVRNPEAGIRAGVEYMSRILSRFDKGIPLKHRLRFALAAYNAGWSHVRDARRLAAQKGWDPDKWFGHTEKAMLLLEQPRYYRLAGSGYCRGSETVEYVSRIQLRYDHYAAMVAR
jgi:membrane-bound lytic murein transglycosylase F